MADDKKIQAYFCPKCKSVDVKYVFGLWNLFGVVPKMRCSKCEFESVGFPMIVTSKKKLAKKWRRHRSVYPKLQNEGAKNE